MRVVNHTLRQLQVSEVCVCVMAAPVSLPDVEARRGQRNSCDNHHPFMED
jgi:hypothetical protein